MSNNIVQFPTGKILNHSTYLIDGKESRYVFGSNTPLFPEIIADEYVDDCECEYADCDCDAFNPSHLIFVNTVITRKKKYFNVVLRVGMIPDEESAQLIANKMIDDIVADGSDLLKTETKTATNNMMLAIAAAIKAHTKKKKNKKKKKK